MLNELWVKHKTKIVIAGAFLVIIITMIVIMVSTGGQRNNSGLSASDRKLQSDIRRETKRNDVMLVEVVMQDGNWKLAKINQDKNRDNYAYVIMKNSVIVLGPGSNFDIETLVDSDVPGKIISYFYSKPYWVNFTNEFATSLSGINYDYIRGVIQVFAANNKIQLDKVTRTSDISRSVANEGTDNESATLQFNFKMNDDIKNYVFKSIFYVLSNRYTYQVTDEAGTVLYSTDANAD